MASLHVLLFPFMAKGHTIPIIQLARLLLRRGAAVTLLTTPGNRSFICSSLSATDAATIIDIPFPQNIAGIPSGIESTDKLPEMSLWIRFAAATKMMQNHFEKTLDSLSCVTFMVTDGFLGWTLDSANKFGIPRLVYYGMSNFVMFLSMLAARDQLILESSSDGNQEFRHPNLPLLKINIGDLHPVFIDPELKKTPVYDFIWEQTAATSKSHGLIVNSFYELESVYCDYWSSEFGPKTWCIGPLCLAEPPINEQQNHQKPEWIKWLDQLEEEGKMVLYVAFGSQSEISPVQFQEIKTGLEKSGVNFLWVVHKNGTEIEEVFEGRIKGRGMVVREWVDQREILEHPSVQGFLSHCGWNSVIESICAKVALLAWPLMSDQPLNAMMVADELGVGLRIKKSRDGFVKWEVLQKAVMDFMEGDAGKEARSKVAEVGTAAAKSVEEGGSSWRTLTELMNEFHTSRSQNT